MRSADFLWGPAGDEGLARCSPLVSEAAAWKDLWETFELLRLLCARLEGWEAHLTAGLGALLSPRERLALPGEAVKVVPVSSDATLDVHAACD